MSKNQTRMSRLRTWSDIATEEPESELEEVAAGRDAEAALQSMVESHLLRKSAAIFHSKRVPTDQRSVFPGRKYEMDLVVVTHKQICVVEIKNWSGTVRVENDQWVQERRYGGVKNHESPVLKNEDKLKTLCRYLEKKDIQMPNARFSRVILWNRNINVPHAISQREDVVMHYELGRFLDNQKASGLGERILASVLDLCLEAETSKLAAEGFFRSISSRDYEAVVQAISSLGTFDKVELFGGRVISGDLHQLQTESGCIDLKKALARGSEVKVERARSKVILFLKAFWGKGPLLSLSPPLRSTAVGPRDMVLFQAAGKRKPDQIRVSRIVRILRG